MVRKFNPSGTVSSSGCTASGAATIHEAIDEGVSTPNDSDFCVAAGDLDQFVVTIPTIDPPPALDSGHKIRYRARQGGVGILDQEVTVTLVQDGSDIWTSGRQLLTGVATDYTETIPDVDAGNITDYSVLSVRFEGTISSGRLFRCFTLEFEIGSEVAVDGTSGGSSSTSATCTGSGALSGSLAASSQVAGVLSEIPGLEGTAAGSSTLSATGSLLADIVGSADGSSALSATGSLIVSIEGSADGSSAVIGTGQAVYAVSSTIAGSSAAVGTMQALGLLIGSSAASSVLEGLLADASGIGVYELVSNVVRLRFQAQIKTPEGLATEWDNAPFASPPDTLWARVSVRLEGARQTYTGRTNGYRKTGQIVIGLFAPIGTGDAAQLALADAIKTAFSLVEVAPVQFGVPSVGPGSRDGAYWRLEVTVPFDADFDIERITGAAPEVLGFEDASNVARSRFSTIAESSLGLDVIYDGEDEGNLDTESTFVRCSILRGSSDLAEIGSTKNVRTVGVVMASIYVPIETGEKYGLSRADLIADYFRAVSDRGVTFRTPLVRSQRREGAWWRIGVVCPFQWDEVS